MNFTSGSGNKELSVPTPITVASSPIISSTITTHTNESIPGIIQIKKLMKYQQIHNQ